MMNKRQRKKHHLGEYLQYHMEVTVIVPDQEIVCPIEAYDRIYDSIALRAGKILGGWAKDLSGGRAMVGGHPIKDGKTEITVFSSSLPGVTLAETERCYQLLLKEFDLPMVPYSVLDAWSWTGNKRSNSIHSRG